jgi:hypothetical protein
MSSSHGVSKHGSGGGKKQHVRSHTHTRTPPVPIPFLYPSPSTTPGKGKRRAVETITGTTASARAAYTPDSSNNSPSPTAHEDSDSSSTPTPDRKKVMTVSRNAAESVQPLDLTTRASPAELSASIRAYTTSVRFIWKISGKYCNADEELYVGFLGNRLKGYAGEIFMSWVRENCCPRTIDEYCDRWEARLEGTATFVQAYPIHVNHPHVNGSAVQRRLRETSVGTRLQARRPVYQSAVHSWTPALHWPRVNNRRRQTTIGADG